MILCCGEALIDFLPRAASGATMFQPLPGGSVYNVAVALGRLGAPVGFYGGMSKDFFGTMLTDALKKSKVDISLVNSSDRPTTLAFVTFIGNDARYAFFDEHSAGRMLTEDDLPPLPTRITALHFGSFSLAAEPCGSGYEALMQRESRARVISLDPNIRPSLIKNRDGYEARLARLIAMSDIVKLSEDDLAWIEADVGFEDYAARALSRGAKLVILTRGENGASAISKNASVSVSAAPVEVADTVGAGDTFTAAILARLDTLGLLSKRAVADLSKNQLSDLLTYASKAASITVSRAGADPPWREEVGG